MGMYDAIKKRCKELGISVSQLERDLGYARGSVGKIDAHKPSYEKLKKIANYLEMDFYELAGVSGANYIKQKISYLLDMEATELDRTPVYNVAAGEGAYNGTYADEFIDEPLDTDDYSFCDVHGDSMSPFILDGDTVKVRHQTDVSPHDFAVVKVGGEHCTVKHVEIVENGVWLRAENKAVYKDRFYTTQEAITLPISIIGKVVELRRKLE